MNPVKTSSYLGKYREIVLAVAFFLVFDLAVLGLNFYISFQIAADAVSINLAGRQRMLSQRMTKALLGLQQASSKGLMIDAGLKEVDTTFGLFDATLRSFELGGQVTGGDGKPVMLERVTTTAGHELIRQAKALWEPFKGLLLPLHSGVEYTPQQLDAAVQYAVANNLTLLKLMNNLTTDLEQTAALKADRLRLVQTTGIVLALLNFMFILFKFIRRLRATDRKAEMAQKETTEILDTVKEGLFLLDAEFRFGSQYSASLTSILGNPIIPGSDFRAMLQAMVAPTVYTATIDYINLLFGDRVRENLVQELNPLTAVEVQVPRPHGGVVQRFLTLQFNRVVIDGRISHLLVTVFDVTKQVELEAALVDAKKKVKAEVNILLGLLDVEPATLNYFLNKTEQGLLEINEQLRSVGNTRHDYRQMVAAIFRQIHALKGDAAALGLTMFEELAQQFEATLAVLRDKQELSGDDLISLPLPLDEFFDRIGMVRDLISRLASYHDVLAPEDNPAALSEDLKKLALRIARDHGKEVEVSSNLQLIKQLPSPTREKLKTIAVQLMRNAVVHGIEPVTERIELAKPAAGHISVALKSANEDGDGYDYEFVLRDDGRGLIPRRIRAALVQTARYSQTHLDELSDVQVIMKIFEPGFSTFTKANRDAGHGVGMDVVKEKLQQLGAHLQIVTREDDYTQFSIRFAV
ncbi:MAG: type IV pili methyl-accepting chemotaxis transducer N-terminal domain-containing protein [Gammaproteobacteria bacterium]|nr:type IV pili methyl-accepting chemotaxis transducer N-terminal domain-containing protein [Gammaproteobacteria bacterium]